MIEVELPDGSIAEFPDGTPPEVMQAAISKRFGPSQQSQTAGKSDLQRISGNILPLSRTPGGPVEFDPGAGIVGAIRRALTLPGEVLSGETPMMGINPETGEVGVPPETIGRALETAGVMTPASRAIRNTIVAKPSVPTSDELLKAGGRGLTQMRKTGAEYPAEQVVSFTDALMRNLQEQGLNARTAKKTFKELKPLTNPTKGIAKDDLANATRPIFADIRDLHSTRKALGEVAQGKNKSDRNAASQAIRELDKLIAGRSDLAPPVGPPTPAQLRAGALLEEANANFSAGKRSEFLEDIDKFTELRASSVASGKNVGNRIRQKVESALERRGPVSGFSESELAQLEAIVRGTRTENVARHISNVLGGGGGLQQGLTAAAGAHLGGPLGAGLAAGSGHLTRAFANRLTQRGLREAGSQVRQRSPLFRQRVQQPGLQAGSAVPPELLIRALIAGELNSGP